MNASKRNKRLNAQFNALLLPGDETLAVFKLADISISARANKYLHKTPWFALRYTESCLLANALVQNACSLWQRQRDERVAKEKASLRCIRRCNRFYNCIYTKRSQPTPYWIYNRRDDYKKMQHAVLNACISRGYTINDIQI